MHSSTKSTIRSCSPWACLLVAVMAMVLVLGDRPAGAQEASPEAGLIGVRQVAAGDYHSCALLANTQVRCFGNGDLGQLGQGVPIGSSTPVTVVNPAGTGPLVNVTQVVTGYEHSCALLISREVRCWGYNGDGELGDGTVDDRSFPTPVKGVSGAGRLQNVTQLAAGGETTCARLSSGQVRCWGYNSAGQIGDDTITERHLPTVVLNRTGTGPLTHVTQIDTGFQYSCARLDSGQARCWGLNTSGQVGDGTTQPRHVPTVVKNGAGSGPLTHVAQVVVGAATQTCARLDSGQARCWGGNTHRELGHGTALNQVLPVVVTNGSGTGPLRGVRQLTAGFFTTCAALTNGQARCWGDNSGGQLGRGTIGGTPRRRPQVVKNPLGTGPLTGVAQIDLTQAHVCVRLVTGQARCWGFGLDGQLGHGVEANSGLPVRVKP